MPIHVNTGLLSIEEREPMTSFSMYDMYLVWGMCKKSDFHLGATGISPVGGLPTGTALADDA